MSVVVVTPPTADIDLDVVKLHLRIDHNDDDALIGAFVAAAVQHIDGPFGWLSRAIWPQVLELRQNVLCGPVRLPYGPASGIVSVTYVDPSGVEQTVPPSTYFLTGDGELVLAHGGSWPSVRGDAEGVRIRYAAGFANLPAAVHSAVLLMVGDLYKHRETTGADGGAVEMSPTVQALLAPFRSWNC